MLWCASLCTVCPPVHPRAYLQKHRSEHRQVSCACYPLLWLGSAMAASWYRKYSRFCDTSCLHILARNSRRANSIYSKWLNGGSMDMTLRCILKLAHREPAAYWGRSLISTIALLHVQNNCDDRQKLVASEIWTFKSKTRFNYSLKYNSTRSIFRQHGRLLVIDFYSHPILEIPKR